MLANTIIFFDQLFSRKSIFPCLLFYTLFCLSQKGFCQAQVHIITDPSDYVEGTRILKSPLKSMKAVYEKPDRFKYVDVIECFDTISRLHWMLTCQSHRLYAKDGHFMTYIFIADKLTPGQIALSKAINPKLHYDVDKTHISQIKGYIRAAYGEKASSEWKDYVTYFSDKEAKKLFNADTLISLLVELKPNEYYEGKYKYLNALFLQKNRRGYITLNCFYDEEGKKNLDKYIKELKGTIWFEE